MMHYIDLVEKFVVAEEDGTKHVVWHYLHRYGRFVEPNVPVFDREGHEYRYHLGMPCTEVIWIRPKADGLYHTRPGPDQIILRRTDDDPANIESWE